MLDSNGGQGVRFKIDLNILEDVGAFFFKSPSDLDGKAADFRIGVRRAAKFHKMPPSAAVAGDKDFGFASVR